MSVEWSGPCKVTYLKNTIYNKCCIHIITYILITPGVMSISENSVMKSEWTCQKAEKQSAPFRQRQGMIACINNNMPNPF